MKLWMVLVAVVGALLLVAIPIFAVVAMTATTGEAHVGRATAAVVHPQPSHRPRTHTFERRFVTPHGKVWIKQQWRVTGHPHGFMRGFRHGFRHGFRFGLADRHMRAVLRWAHCVVRQATLHPTARFSPQRVCGPRPKMPGR
jgi:hypothetical protein